MEYCKIINRRRSTQETTQALPVVSYHHCPAKTYNNDNGQRCLGRSVFEHCLIVGEIARALINRFPSALQQSLFPPGSALLAAVHDVGKVSPTFFLKLQRSISDNNSAWLSALAELIGIDEMRWGGHAGVSALALKAICNDPVIGKIAGQHHGINPSTVGYQEDSEVLGGKTWQEQRHQLVLALRAALNEEFPLIHDHQQLVLAGLTTVADWVGSGSFFEDPSAPWQPNIYRALDDAGFITPTLRNGLAFGDIFQNNQGMPYQPNQTQITLYQNCLGKGVYILEAPMGLGKTEAALYAAYQVLQRGEACGIYFALPTQLASNKIYDRFNHFLKTILTEDSHHRRSLLLHGNAWLMDRELGEEGRPGHSWFDSSKRGLLAPFTVGTLDQALMAAMNVRHGSVRAFGLAGKVVILDEVHSYDVYTSTLLNALITQLRSLDCTVIILSATLTSSRRTELLGQPTATQAYPLITASLGNNTEGLKEYPVVITQQQQVTIKMMPMDHQPILDNVLARAESGEQVLWIENTVAEAQERYLEFAARSQELDIACGLLHSRFTLLHRQSNEEHWVHRFGKSGWEERTKQGRILIGTQVLEQSLDIDADLLVTRFAPSDMLLQRLGRLWRHQGTPRPAGARCQAWILAPNYQAAEANPRTAFAATASVYDPYILCRSLEVWQQQVEKDTLTLPADIRPLLEASYRKRTEQGAMAQWQYELVNGNRYRKGSRSLQQLARVGLTLEGKTLPESKAQTRYSEQETAQLLLLRQFSYDTESKITHLCFLDGSKMQLPWRQHYLSKTQWRQLAAQLMQHIVTCHRHQLPRAPSREWCQEVGLGNILYLGSKEWDEAGVAVALVSQTNELKAIDGMALPLSSKHSYSYRDDIGLRINKIKE